MNHSGFENQDPTSKTTASRTLFLATDPLNYRQLFIQSLFLDARGLNYGLLTPFRSVNELCSFTKMEVLILPDELAEWKEIFNYSSYISKTHISSIPGGYKALLKFFDHATLELKLITTLTVQGLVFAQIEEYIHHSLINRDGVKRISRVHNFEYNYIHTCFSGEIFTKETGLYLLSAYPEDQREILTYFEEKYGIGFPNMIRLLNNVFLCRERIESVLRAFPVNSKKAGTFFKKNTSGRKYSKAL